MKNILALAALLAAIGLSSCGHDDSITSGSGLIEATEVTISAEASGRVERLYKNEGDQIGIGDTIASIDTTTLTLQLAQSRALRQAALMQKKSAELQIEKAALEVDLADKEYNRSRNLLSTGSANQQQYDQAENRLNQTRLAQQSAQTARQMAEADLQKIAAQIALLEKQLADCRPLSPAAGTVVTDYIEVGELIAAGKPLIKVAQLDTVWVKIYLPSQDLTRIKLGDTAQVDPEDGRSRPLNGFISWISPEAEFTPKNVQTREARADLVYAVKVTIPNPDAALKIGMPVMVQIP